MIKGHMDGLQVLKGGQGKATIYFKKEEMHGALDLNEQDIVIGITENNQVEVSPYDGLKESIMARVDDLITKVREDRKPSLLPAMDGVKDGKI